MGTIRPRSSSPSSVSRTSPVTETTSTFVMVAARVEALSTSTSYTTWVRPSLPVNGIGESRTDATSDVSS